jgi:hypothetical protein
MITVAGAATYVVDPYGTGDFPTIQAALDAVLDGDVIELTDGTFFGPGNRDLDYLGKAVVVRSQSDDPELCTINSQGCPNDPHRGVSFHSREGPGSVLAGVTITNGYVDGDQWHEWTGGGVQCYNGSAPTLLNCIFLANQARNGAGVYCRDGCSLTIEDCVFLNNYAFRWGAGGLYVYLNSSATVTNCIFDSNRADDYGAGVLLWTGCAAKLDNCTFVHNTVDHGGGGGVSMGDDSEVSLINCTFSGNAASQGGGIYPHPHSIAVATLHNTIIAFSTEGQAISDGDVLLICCDLYGNAGGDWVGSIASQHGSNGNIREDPLFCGPADFRLHCSSPCAPFSPPNPECDLIGAWPVGCGGSPVCTSTWGGIKAMFRR